MDRAGSASTASRKSPSGRPERVRRDPGGPRARGNTRSSVLEALPLEPYDPAVQMRTTFSSVQKCSRARLYVTSHGIYEIRINGKPVSDTWLDPGFTTYDKRLKYQVYNVDDLIIPGQNAIAVTVADGWYKGKIAIGRGCDYGEVPGLLLQLELTYADGSRKTICTDEDWKYSYDGPVRTADLFLGEIYDARKINGDPSLPGYNDSGWLPVRTGKTSAPVPEAQISPQVKYSVRFPPWRS